MVTSTYGAALNTNVRKPMPAVVPTMMLGTDEIRVSKPPTLVSKPSTSRKASSLSLRPSRSSDTALNDPIMIIAVTLFSTAENTTVIRP